MTIANELAKLDTQRKALADNLVVKSVVADQSETLSELVPKVLQVPQEGGGGLDTNDATAYAEHILEGYTAYARGQKITGTYTNIVLPNYQGLLLHLDASDVANFTFEENNVIAEWKDISGNDNHCSVSSEEKPLHVSNVLNGCAAVQFGTGARFALQDFDLSAHTCFVLMKSLPPTANKVFLRSAELALGWRDNGNQFSYATNYGDNTSQLPYSIDNYISSDFNLFCVQRNIPSQGYARLNFKHQATVGSSEYWWAVGDPYLGNLDDGYIAEVLLYNTFLSPLEITTIENYFINKYFN